MKLSCSIRPRWPTWADARALFATAHTRSAPCRHGLPLLGFVSLEAIAAERSSSLMRERLPGNGLCRTRRASRRAPGETATQPSPGSARSNRPRDRAARCRVASRNLRAAARIARSEGPPDRVDVRLSRRPYTPKIGVLIPVRRDAISENRISRTLPRLGAGDSKRTAVARHVGGRAGSTYSGGTV